METQRDDVRTSTVAMVGLLGTIALVAVVLLVDLIAAVMVEREVRLHESEPAVTLRDRAQARQEARLAEYRWVNRDAKPAVAAVPIDRAAELVLRDLTARKEEDHGRTP
jgi:hypothetical protein